MYELYINLESTRRKSLKKSVNYIFNKLNNCGCHICYVSTQYYDTRTEYYYCYYKCNINVRFDDIALNTMTRFTHLLNRVNRYVNINEMQFYEVEENR